LDVALIDRRNSPPQKACGDFVSEFEEEEEQEAVCISSGKKREAKGVAVAG